MTPNILHFSLLVFKGTFSGVVCKAQVDELIAGEVGYLAASIKAVADARVGDTITLKKNQAAEALAGLFFLPFASFFAVLPQMLRSLFWDSMLKHANMQTICSHSGSRLSVWREASSVLEPVQLVGTNAIQCCLPRSGSGSARQW